MEISYMKVLFPTGLKARVVSRISKLGTLMDGVLYVGCKVLHRLSFSLAYIACNGSCSRSPGRRGTAHIIMHREYKWNAFSGLSGTIKSCTFDVLEPVSLSWTRTVGREPANAR